MNQAVAAHPFAFIGARFRQRLAQLGSCSSETRFALCISLIWTALYNAPFWERTLEAMWHPTLGGVTFLVSLFGLVLSLQALLLLLMPTTAAMRTVASVLFITAAGSSYFIAEYGVILNKDMLRNVLETDPAEVSALLNVHLLATLAVFGIAPAVLVWQIALPPRSWRKRLRQRAIALGTVIAVCLACLFASSADYAVFFRQHKPIRFTLVPFAPVTSLIELVSQDNGRHADETLLNPAGQTRHVGATRARPLVIFLVIGETARAANFALGTYPRATNPELEHTENLVYFTHATACGTSTATSVPCMFSHLGRSDFNVDEAPRFTNLLDALAASGFDVQWRDNNAGCKGVCTRVATVRYAGVSDDKLCPRSYCYDEVMLTDLAERLRTLERDSVIVFHQIGSHGPAYADRYPPELERFKPACRSNELQHCTQQEILNAYDNTIAYTDHVLAAQIALLRSASDQLDSILIYASDHGESLGEQGVYLHGMPFGFAPEGQKRVPMLIWTSEGYQERTRLDVRCVREHADTAVSHDNLYHTVLGAAELSNQVYNPLLDILAACRHASLGE